LESIEILKPDDWHVHFRDHEIMKAVVPETSRNFSRALVMPNLLPPILSGKDAVNYKKRIEKTIPSNHNFIPLMTIYLTEKTDKKDLEQSFNNGIVFGAKLYPAGATTNSDSGVKNIEKIIPLLEIMEKIGMPLLIHGEVTDNKVDIYDREKVFIETILYEICKKFPNLKITLEHITTKDAVTFIKQSNHNVAATITPQHLALNRNAIFSGGIKPHYYCLPILKREEHRLELIKAATSGNKKFFLGSDTAPHFLKEKQSECGCAGIFNASYCMSILAEIFDKNNSISKLQNFTSLNGSYHYNIKPNSKKIKLIKNKNPLEFLDSIKVGKNSIKIFKPDFNVFWEVI
jgi:dihydroorotase